MNRKITGYRLSKVGPLEDFVVPIQIYSPRYNQKDILTVNIVGNGTAVFHCPFLAYEAPELIGVGRIKARVERINNLENKI